MSFSFGTSLSGLNANSNALGVVGNNIANANTVGYRSSSITFADVYANSNGIRLNGAGTRNQIGNGVSTAAIHANFSQGSLNESGSPLHAAVSGNGMFIVRDSNGATGYTRAGDFILNKQGYLVAPNGGQAQGYTAVNGTIPPGSPLTPLQLPIGQSLPPQATSSATFRMNLASNSADGSQFHAKVQIYDTRGGAHQLDLVFQKQPNGSFVMTPQITGDNGTLQANGQATETFTFDASGTLQTPTTLSLTRAGTFPDGSVMQPITINLRETNPDGTPGAFNITNYSSDNGSAVSSTTQDGYAAGEMQGASIDQDGIIYAVYTNGETRAMGQFALATFNSYEGLNRMGGNMFGETPASGEPTIGEPNSGGRGGIAGGMLEQSNVNITNEFIELIEAQRGFQANSRVITTVNQTFQDILQVL